MNKKFVQLIEHYIFEGAGVSIKTEILDFISKDGLYNQ